MISFSRPLALAAVIMAVLPWMALAHPAELDSYGCHYYDSKDGISNYHCHKGAFRGQAFNGNQQARHMTEGISENLYCSTSPVAGSTGTATDRFWGKVTTVVDGDTLVVFRGSIGEQVELFGIDAPEMDQAFGKDATIFVADAIARHSVRIDIIQHAKLCICGRVFLDGDRELNRELVRVGLAWWDSRTAPADKVLKGLQDEARKARRGLWAGPHIADPRDFREAAKLAERQRGRNAKRLGGPIKEPSAEEVQKALKEVQGELLKGGQE